MAVVSTIIGIGMVPSIIDVYIIMLDQYLVGVGGDRVGEETIPAQLFDG